MKIVVTVSGDLTIVTVDGNLVAEARKSLVELEEQVTTPEVLFVLSGLGTINSAGVAVWTAVMKRLSSGRSLRFQEAPFSFLDYCNMIPAMLAGGQLLSFELPFACESCNEQQSTVVERKAVADTQERTALSIICPRCGNKMTPDCNLDEYAYGPLA